jgi:hypothetical protein
MDKYSEADLALAKELWGNAFIKSPKYWYSALDAIVEYKNKALALAATQPKESE